ncbi:MAG: tRNA guanosine(15) transglycosylase TgtA [Candidatus Thermoplasmatota archaeon]|nr:tRNA guanosine(15) transglycosylase TgtA [Candidatus Thermoplasmatota archaeon]
MAVWMDSSRENPKPCRENDLGKFELVARDGCARVGKLHTSHGILETPALLPVINPNIRTIEPREMWDRYGIQGLITNSYIIWKHDDLKNHAVNKGVHDLLDFPGVIMTDSGTFQSYVYGDVEVGVEEIVEFQRSIGVDIATMLDVFSRPDMTEDEVQQAVRTTIQRCETSLEAAEKVMLNGPIQGGTFRDLRKQSAREMGRFDFAIHPIGGIVPIMEKHQYKDLVKIMLATIGELPPERPRHMFGCGHPMLFSILIALGADLFDSAAYALFARDDRLLSPQGTYRLNDLHAWPELVPCIVNWTPENVRALDADERKSLLARYNLEVTLAELSRCKQAVHDGTIWQLAEQRSHQHPALREAFLWLTTRPFPSGLSSELLEDLVQDDRTAAREHHPNGGVWESDWSHIVNKQALQRKKGERWGGEDTLSRPHILAARKRLHHRWRPSTSTPVDVLVLNGKPGPWRQRCDLLVTRLKHVLPELEILVQTPIGLLPYSLEDLNPFGQVDGPTWLWKRRLNPVLLREETKRLHIDADRILILDIGQDALIQQASDLLMKHGILQQPIQVDDSELSLLRDKLRRRQVLDKLAVLMNVDYGAAAALIDSCTYVIGGTGRVKNVIDQHGNHILSPRLTDGGLSVTDLGAKVIHDHRSISVSEKGKYSPYDGLGDGPPVLVVEQDAVEFVLRGRNVFHGFIIKCDSWLKAGQTCFIVDEQGTLIGHGISQCDADEVLRFRKGIAVRVRSDFSKTFK